MEKNVAAPGVSNRVFEDERSWSCEGLNAVIEDGFEVLRRRKQTKHWGFMSLGQPR
jgi:hypothetical protein